MNTICLLYSALRRAAPLGTLLCNVSVASAAVDCDAVYWADSLAGQVLRLKREDSDRRSLAAGPFRYPVGPDCWHKRVNGFASLNSRLEKHPLRPFAPHLGEDWNIDNGGDSDAGRPVVAIADGTVAAINYVCPAGNRPPVGAPSGATCEATEGWGVSVLLEHTAPPGQYFVSGRGEKLFKVYSHYAHLLPFTHRRYDRSRNIQVGINQEIRKGEPVGQVGTPVDEGGRPLGPFHLHFEILRSAGDYRRSAGYGWNLGNYLDPTEFIENNRVPHYILNTRILDQFAVYVRPYGDTSSPVPSTEFALDGLSPARGVSQRRACHYRTGSWQREGCNFSADTELGYGGELFTKAAEAEGSATWTPTLPQQGRYVVSIFVPSGESLSPRREGGTYVRGIGNYQLLNSGGERLASFAINHESYELFRDGVAVPSGGLVARLSIGHRSRGEERKIQYGAWVTVGIYELPAGKETTVKLVGSQPRPGERDDRVAADAVRFVYAGESLAQPPPPPEDPPPVQ